MKRLLSRCVPVLLLLGTHGVTEAQTSSVSKSTWSTKDGYELPARIIMVDYGSKPVALSLRNAKLLVNGISAGKLSDADLATLEAVAGCNLDSIVRTLKEQKRPAWLQVEFAVLRQIDDGKMVQMPIAMMAPDDRQFALQTIRQIGQTRQFMMQLAAARAIPVGVGATSPVAAGASAGNYEQQGQFEGQFGDQTGPDIPGAPELPSGIDN